MYVLIDTCVWRNLISKSDFSILLQRLDSLVKHNKVSLIIPPVLVNEWDKHRKLKQEELAKEIKNLENLARKKATVNDPFAPLTAERVAELKLTIMQQFQLIDDLMDNHSIRLNQDSVPEDLINRQKEGGKAPFHVNKQSINDARLLYTAMAYCESKKINELFFISSNTRDFSASPETPSVLHPNFNEVFPSLAIFYFQHIKDAFNEWEKRGIPNFKKDSISNSRLIKNDIRIDRDLPILSQLDQYFELRLDQLTILPKQLLLRCYPFILSENYTYYDVSFALITDNPELFELLKNVKVERGQVTDQTDKFIRNPEDEQKAVRIFKALARNFIYNVSFKNNQSQPIQFTDQLTICDCGLCSYRSLQWPVLFEKLYNDNLVADNESIFSGMKRAYAHYRIGDFLTSGILFESLYEKQKNHPGVLRYILGLNLKYLGVLMFNYIEDPEPVRVKKWRDINLKHLYIECRKCEPKDWEILAYIHEAKFYKDTKEKLETRLHELQERYHKQSTGHSDATRNVLEVYQVTEAFLNQNYIVYDKFSEFDKITDLFTESLMASIACNKGLSGRLNYFNDQLIEKLVLHGNFEAMRKYALQYPIEKYPYVPSAESTFSLKKSVLSLFGNRLSPFEGVIEKQIPTFLNDHWNIWLNAVAMVILLDMNTRDLRQVTKALILNISSHKQLHPVHLATCLRWLLDKKHSQLTDAILKNFWKLIFAHKEFHEDSYSRILHQILTNRKLKLHLSAADWQNAKKIIMGKCPECGREHSWHLLGEFCQLCDDTDQKKEIRKFVKESVAVEFISGKYYLACMYGIIRPDSNHNDLYSEEILGILKKGQNPRTVFYEPFYTDNRVDHYLNFCFRFKLGIPRSIRKNIGHLGDYYRWFSNLEHFNYKKFEIEWLNNHFSIHYKQHFRRSNRLKKELQGLDHER